MITINFNNILFDNGIKFLDNNIFFEIKGHALFDKKGKDIVCAAVSVLSQTIILSLSKIIKVTQNIKQENGYLKSEINLINLDNEKLIQTKILIETLFIGIFEISKQYPEKIKINFN